MMTRYPCFWIFARTNAITLNKFK